MQLASTRTFVLSLLLAAGAALGCDSTEVGSKPGMATDPTGNAGVPGAGSGGALSAGSGAGSGSGAGMGGSGPAMSTSTGGSSGTAAPGGAPAADAGVINPPAMQDAATPGVGTQPRGAVCANDSNCSQAAGDAVCCVNTCTLAAECAGDVAYLKCATGSDCAVFGGGKLCCEMGPMRFCTKRSACTGQIIP